MIPQLSFNKISSTGKTDIFEVSCRGMILGKIKWYAPWRKYIFEAYHAIFDSSCLANIISKLDSLMIERKDKIA